MVRKSDRGYIETCHVDAVLVKDEVEFLARCPARVGRQALGVCRSQSSRFHEQVDLVFAPERIEIACDDDRLLGCLYEVIEMPQLQVPVPVFQGQVDEKDREIVHFEFDDEPLDSRVEIVEALAVDARRGHEGVPLLAHDRQDLVERLRAILGLIRRVHAEIRGDLLGLVDVTAADGPGVHLDQANNVRINRLDEARNLGENGLVAEHITRTRYRHTHARAIADSVPDVVEKKPHAPLRYRNPQTMETASRRPLTNWLN